MYLLEYIEKRDLSQRLIYANDRWLTAGEVLDIVRNDRSNLSVSCEVIRTMLVGGDDYSIAMGLLCLDGWAESILPVNGCIEENLKNKFIRDGMVNVVVEKDEITEIHESPYFSRRPLPNGEDTQWIIPTSGTTGEPKLIAHSLRSLSSSVKKNQGRGASLIWGMIYDITRFAGIQVFLQAVMGGASLAVSTDRNNLETTANEFAAAGVNALSATPTMWRKLVMSGVLDSLNLEMITLGGEPADQMILTELRERFPHAKITSIYASTEAGVGFSVTDDRAGFPVSYTKKELLGGVWLRVDGQKLLLRKETTPVSCLGKQESLVDDRGWLDTQDLVKQEGDRYLFLGRANGAINVGGQKVQPTEVEAIIRSLEGIKMVAVRGRKNPFTGSVVEALVVKDDGFDDESVKKSVFDACREGLDSFKRPASVKIVDEIQVTSTGKIQRN